MKRGCLLVVLFLASLQFIVAEPRLRERWSTARVFKVPESVFYDRDTQRIYVSNINGRPLQKNWKGFLSLLDVSGSIRELEWVTGLNAPKGMGIYQNKLYVTDIDQIVVIDKSRGNILTRHYVPGAKFLNDIAVDPEGTVYVSDSGANSIVALKAGKVSIPLSAGMLENPNGFFWEGNSVLIGVKDRILKWQPRKEELEVFIEAIGGIDGLQPTGAGDYLISDWRGIIRLVSSGGSRVLMDVTSQKINTADFCYIIEKNLLIVPTFGHNQLWTFELVRK